MKKWEMCVLHYWTSVRVVITEHRNELLINHWLMVIAKVFTIAISMLVITVRRSEVRVVSTMIVMIFWVVWIWPQLCSSTCLPHCFQYLLFLCPTHHSYLLQPHIYVHIINSYKIFSITVYINSNLFSLVLVISEVVISSNLYKALKYKLLYVTKIHV